MRKLLLLISWASVACPISFEQAKDQIIDAGKFLHKANLCPATGGNISVRLDSNEIAITVSGKHKGELIEEDVMLVDYEGASLSKFKKPSAETLLHTAIYQAVESANAVLHHHTINGIVLSRLLNEKNELETEGYEVHKVFPNITTHESKLIIPIFENSQDYHALSNTIAKYLIAHPQTYGFLIRGHGFTTWGSTMEQAKLHVENFEYLFECELKFRGK